MAWSSNMGRMQALMRLNGVGKFRGPEESWQLRSQLLIYITPRQEGNTVLVYHNQPHHILMFLLGIPHASDLIWLIIPQLEYQIPHSCHAGRLGQFVFCGRQAYYIKPQERYIYISLWNEIIVCSATKWCEHKAKSFTYFEPKLLIWTQSHIDVLTHFS